MKNADILNSLLKESRAALLSGDLARLEAIAGRIAAAPPPTTSGGLEAVRTLVLQNLAALEAARAGLRDAARIAEEALGQAPVETYDGKGERKKQPAVDSPPLRRV